MTAINKTNYKDIEERLIALTRDLILIPSIPSRPDDRQRCFEFIKNHLESIEHIEVKEYQKDGFPSLIAAPKGCVHPDILMVGHLDVITHPDISVYRSEIKEGRIYGPGSGDMKGQLSILIEIFRHIHSLSRDASLAIAVTSDEEVGGESGIGYLVKEEGIRCNEAMIPDGGGLNRITIEEKGILHLEAVCHGHTAHAARPWLGQNPIEHLMDQLRRLRTFFDEKKEAGTNWHPTCAVTMIRTENQTINRIPDSAAAALDVRFPSPYTSRKLLTEINRILGEGIFVNVIISAEATELSPDPMYLKMTETVTGLQAKLVKDHGGSDARFLAAFGIPVIISRPTVGNLHAEDEWIDINSMTAFYQIYEKFLIQRLKIQGTQ
ncbi:MAG: M20 family metallopeptidase [Nitrospiria bacterium]